MTPSAFVVLRVFIASCESPGLLDAQRALGLRNDLVKCRWVGNGDLAQALAVERDLRLQQAVDEQAIADAAGLGRCRDARDPQCPIVPLLGLAVLEAVIACTQQGLMRCFIKFATAADKTFGAGEQTFVPLFTGGTDANAWH